MNHPAQGSVPITITADEQKTVQGILGYVFRETPSKFLDNALKANGLRNHDNYFDGNLRLALLGNHVLDTILTDMWLEHGVRWSRKQMNKKLSHMTSNRGLELLCKRTGLIGFIKKRHNHSKYAKKAPADTIEALIGAVWRDSQSITDVRMVVMRLVQDRCDICSSHFFEECDSGFLLNLPKKAADLMGRVVGSN